jgi:DNA topoisomerase-3
VECGGYKFSAQGKVVLQDGWGAIDAEFRASLKEKLEPDGDGEDDSDGALPDLADGQELPCVIASVREGKTSPPKRFTEDRILAAMECAGADDSLAAERRGLGTPATRAGIIEKLIKSGFVERKKKLLVPTEKGSNLIAILPEDLKSPLLTAEWEQKLFAVQSGELSGDEFMEGISALTTGLVAAHAAPIPAFASLFVKPPKGGGIGKCLRCGAPVTESSKGFFCSSRACRFGLWKDSMFWAAKGKKLDKKTAAALLQDGSAFFSDLKSEKTGKTYAATIILEDDGQRVSYRLDFNSERKIV